MAISAKTTDEIIRTLAEWAKENNVPLAAVKNLLQRLSAVPGNKSFEDSVRKILALIP